MGRPVGSVVDTFIAKLRERDVPGIAALYQRDAVLDLPFGGGTGRAAIGEAFSVLVKIFNTGDGIVPSTMIGGDSERIGAFEFVGSGWWREPRKPGQEPPEPVLISVNGAMVIELDADGLIVRHTGYWDRSTVHKQLGR
ncbi:MAG: nuclear transport factor 2 family protein [Acidimicrobiia bacterium]